MQIAHSVLLDIGDSRLRRGTQAIILTVTQFQGVYLRIALCVGAVLSSKVLTSHVRFPMRMHLQVSPASFLQPSKRQRGDSHDADDTSVRIQASDS